MFELQTLKISGQLFYKYGTIYRDVLHSPRIDVCQIMNSTNKLVKQIIEMIDDSALGIVHPCPYTVKPSFKGKKR